MRPPEKPHGIDYFIDRASYTRAVRNLIESEKIVYVIGDTNATYGSGKTTILGKLYTDLCEAERAGESGLHPIWMSLNLFSSWHRNPQLKNKENEVEVFAQNIRDYYDLLKELAEDQLSDAEKVSASLLKMGLQPLDALRQSDPNLKVDLDGDMDQWQAALNFVKTAEIAQNPTIAAEDFRYAVHRAAEAMTYYFLDRFNEKHLSRRSVVFADDFCWISYQPIGDWVLNGLGRGMDNTVLIVSHTQGESDLPPDATDQQKLRLSNFTPEEVGEYLEKRLTTEEESGKDLLRANPELVSLVYEFANKGHCQTVCLVADLLKYAGVRVGMELVKNAAETRDPNKPIDTQEAMAEIVQKAASKLSQTVQPTWLRYAMRLGAVLRRFDGQLLVELMRMGSADFNEAFPEVSEDAAKADAAADSSEAGEVLSGSRLEREITKVLERYSFVDYYRQEAAPYYAFHPFVAEQLRLLLGKPLEEDDTSPQGGILPLLNPNDPYPADFRGLHALAHKYYSDIIAGYEDQDESEVFVALHLYEDPRWQIVESEWLYHFLSYKADEQRDAELEFVRVYLQAFQWWAYYIPFPFCDRLLTEWQSTKIDKKYKAIAALRKFHEIYPLGTPKQKKNDARWAKVQEYLEEIITYFDLMDYANMRLHRKLEAGESDLLMNLLELYAGCFRFAKEPDYERAQIAYELEAELARVQEEAEENDESGKALSPEEQEAQEALNKFNASYAHAYEAEMQMEFGQYEAAQGNLEAAAEQFRAAEANARQGLIDVDVEPRPFQLKTDYELISLCWRIIGEVALIDRRYADAADAYLNASQFAAVYNFYQVPLPPDPYTLRWNADMNHDIADSLIQASKATGDAEIVKIAQYLYQSREVYDQFYERKPDAPDFPALLEAGDVRALSDKLFVPLLPDAAAKTKDHVFLQNGINFAYKLLDTKQSYR